MSGSGSRAVPEPRQTRSETKSRCKSLRLCSRAAVRLRPEGAGLAAAGAGPGAPGPVPFAWPGRSAERGFALPPAPEARGVLAGRGRPSLPSAEAVSSRQPVRGGERDPEPPSARGSGWRLEDAAGAEVPARNTHWQNSTRSTFLVLGKFLQWCFVALRHFFNALAENETQPY